MNQEQISLKSINELRLDADEKAMQFFIPAYQRGYRWSPLQVTQLLNDIGEFVQRPNPQPDEFYCLQPLVIKALPGGDFEVVDGQQRLTTLFLILRHFNERLAKKYQQVLYVLTYKTREKLDSFLEDPTEQSANDNVDFFHIFQAMQAIDKWFGEPNRDVEAIKSALLNKTKIIWFQLSERDNPVEAFTRLNVGKIPLTNDELIRALFLRRTGPDDKEAENVQLRISYEWDQIEKALQSNDFWYFLSNKDKEGQNRISFIFELIAGAEAMPAGSESAYGIFYAFQQRLKTVGATPENEWQKIKQTYLMLEEWFEDRTLYHMVGFLVSEGVPLDTLRGRSLDCTKSTFERRLRQDIFRRTFGGTLPDPTDEQAVGDLVAQGLEPLSYTHDPRKIRSLLLLLNLATLLQDSRSNLRFQFDSFKREQWDIEHIRSVTDDKPERPDDRRNWLEHCLHYLAALESDRTLREEIAAFLALTRVEATNEVFDPLYEKVLVYFHESKTGEAEHGIANLTLLDAKTNRSYKNAVFAVKRQRVLSLDQAGIFVPLCTRNSFLKCYSPQVDNTMFWSEADQEGYQEAIISALVKFFCGKTEGIQ